MFKRSSPITGFTFVLLNTAVGTPVTTGTVNAFITKDGGTQTTLADTPVHEGNGQWSVDISADEMTAEIVGLLFTASGAVPAAFTIKTDTKIVSEVNDIPGDSTIIVSGGVCDGSAAYGSLLAHYDPERITELFKNVRDTLNDPDKERWSDEVLLRNLRKAIRNVAVKTRIFKDSVVIPVVNGQSKYQLPNDVLKVNSVTYEWEPVPIKSSYWMDQNTNHDWRYTTTEDNIKYIVFDEVKRQELQVYPRPFGDFDINYDFTGDTYGVTTDLTDYEVSPLYGVAAVFASVDVHEEIDENLYGVLVNVKEFTGFVVYYTKCPPLPYSLSDSLALDPCFDNALEHYVTALAYRNDVDIQNRSMANEEFVLYNQELQEIQEIASTDSMEADVFESDYNPIG